MKISHCWAMGIISVSTLLYDISRILRIDDGCASGFLKLLHPDTTPETLSCEGQIYVYLRGT